MRKQFEIMSFKKTFLYILALYFFNFEVVSGNGDSPSVIIIGAGAAGIAAASRLFENGFKKVTILEAEDRIGGRIHTAKFSGHLVDLGAQYVYKETTDTTSEIKWPFAIMGRELCGFHRYIMYDSSGTRLDDNIANYFEEVYENSDLGTSISSEENRVLSVGEYIKRAFQKNFEFCPALNDKNGLIDMILMSDSATFGTDISNVSPKNYKETSELDGDVYNWKRRGYSLILDILMKPDRYAEKLPVINETILNEKVSLIVNNLKDRNVIIKTTKGNTYCADHVIVTIPLGVLKAKYDKLFNPPLPQEKIKTIKGLGYGNQEKIFLFFRKPFWRYVYEGDLDGGFNLVWKDSDRAALEQDPERKWLLGLHELRFVRYKPPILMSRVSGEHSLEMDKLSNEQILKHLTEVLEKFFGKDYKDLKPTKMLRSMWNTNKNFRGSWTYYKVKEPNEEEVFCGNLAKPIGQPKPRILFAGEATHPQMFGSVQGAIMSGIREAQRLTELYPHLMQTDKGKGPSTSQ